jgi:hypothetical protein
MDACMPDFSGVAAVLSGRQPVGRVIRPTQQRPRPMAPVAVSVKNRELLLGRVGDEVPVVGRVVSVYPYMDKGRTTFINFGNYRNDDFTIVAFDRISNELLRKYGERLDTLRGA